MEIKITLDVCKKILKYEKLVINMTRKELLLLEALLRKKRNGGILTYSEIILAIWPERSLCENGNNILQLIFQVRKKMREITPEPCIINIHKKGYKLSPILSIKTIKSDNAMYKNKPQKIHFCFRMLFMAILSFFQ